MKTPKTRPCLWFDGNAQDAARFYVSVFKNSKITGLSRYGKGMPGPEGSVMAVTFTLDGQPFMGLNAGPQFKFSPAVSFMVYCRTQKEIDRYWKKLGQGGRYVQCGWLTDKFGVSWQIVPADLDAMLTKGGPKKCQRVMAEVMQMTKLDLARMKKAYQGD